MGYVATAPGTPPTAAQIACRHDFDVDPSCEICGLGASQLHEETLARAVKAESDVARLRVALETVALDAKRCTYCAEETPEGVAPLACHQHGFGDRPSFACDEHRSRIAKETERRNAYAVFFDFTQPAHVTIALAALEAE